MLPALLAVCHDDWPACTPRVTAYWCFCECVPRDLRLQHMPFSPPPSPSPLVCGLQLPSTFLILHVASEATLYVWQIHMCDILCMQQHWASHLSPHLCSCSAAPAASTTSMIGDDFCPYCLFKL
jgi:hypothetical protein